MFNNPSHVHMCHDVTHLKGKLKWISDYVFGQFKCHYSHQERETAHVCSFELLIKHIIIQNAIIHRQHHVSKWVNWHFKCLRVFLIVSGDVLVSEMIEMFVMIKQKSLRFICFRAVNVDNLMNRNELGFQVWNRFLLMNILILKLVSLLCYISRVRK